jgi:hypothetical protein
VGFSTISFLASATLCTAGEGAVTGVVVTWPAVKVEAIINNAENRWFMGNLIP